MKVGEVRVHEEEAVKEQVKALWVRVPWGTAEAWVVLRVAAIKAAR